MGREDGHERRCRWLGPIAWTTLNYTAHGRGELRVGGAAQRVDACEHYNMTRLYCSTDAIRGGGVHVYCAHTCMVPVILNSTRVFVATHCSLPVGFVWLKK